MRINNNNLVDGLRKMSTIYHENERKKVLQVAEAKGKDEDED